MATGAAVNVAMGRERGDDEGVPGAAAAKVETGWAAPDHVTGDRSWIVGW
jgi:hypothetical protein